jgi:uncharacterized protein YndB with AHSA1/START domain
MTNKAAHRCPAALLGLAAFLVAGASDQPRNSDEDGLRISTATTPVKRQDFVIDIPAPVEQVWRSLTTAVGTQEFFPSQPRIELKVGGNYEIFAGVRNRVLTFLPERMLMTTGSAPPQLPEVRKGGTWGVFQFEPIEGGKATRLRLGVFGWRDGNEWDDAFAYFLKHNPVFLRMIRKRFAGEPLASPSPRKDEAGTARARSLHKEAVVVAPREEVWSCWTTSAGMKTFLASESKIELTPGGAYELYFGPPSAAPARGSEGCKVLGYLPGEILSFDWNAPPQFREVRDQRTCVLIRLEPAGAGKTRVILDHHGWGQGEQWDAVYNYFDQAWDLVMDHLKKRFGAK